MHIFLFVALGFCAVTVHSGVDHERTASLVVLPPLVLGYDELYQDSPEAPVSKSPARVRSYDQWPADTRQTANNSDRAELVKLLRRMPLDRLVLYDDIDKNGEEAIIIPQQRIVLRRSLGTTHAPNEATAIRNRTNKFYLRRPTKGRNNTSKVKNIKKKKVILGRIKPSFKKSRVYVKEVQDEDISGSNTERPQYQDKVDLPPEEPTR